MKRPLILIIMDGFGISELNETSQKINAIKFAKTPNLDEIFKSNPYTLIKASGEAVGLPEGQMGNSEVGHMTMGSGRIIYQDFTRISKSIENKEFFENKILNGAIDHALKNDSSLHLMGLLSSGGVHSHIDHLYALVELAKKRGLSKVFIHAFLDGRDTLPNSGIDFIKDCNKKLKENKIGKIATICGRYYAMDRDNRWGRTQKAYNLLTVGAGEKNEDPILAVKNFYKKNITDEFMAPILIDQNGVINDNDSVVFFNFRPDRARELTRAIVDKEFDGFETKKINTYFVCMTPYDETMPNVEIAYKKEELKNTFGEYISRNGLKQLRIAETEKYAHVTFFFNGGEEKQYEGEDRILVPSPKVETYDLKPEMSAYEVCDKVVEAIKSEKYDSIILNFANPDMVGHTGSIEAAIKALEAIDECVQRVVEAIESVNGVLLITADHGNCEQMIDYKTGEPHTAHTTNPVPLAIIGLPSNKKIKEGRLADLAPTMLEIMELEKPDEMTGESLLEN